MMVRPACIALLLAVSAVAVGACGSDDDSADSASDTSTTSGVIAPQGTTSPRGGATGATGTGRSDRKTGKTKQPSDNKTESAAPTAPTAQKPQPNQRSLSRAELKEVGHELGKQARILCKASTLEGLAQQYGIKNPDPDQVAKAFAAGYLAGLRDAVAAGCKAGLLESK